MKKLMNNALISNSRMLNQYHQQPNDDVILYVKLALNNKIY